MKCLILLGIVTIVPLLCQIVTTASSKYTTQYPQGSSVTYHCDDGYTMTGDHTQTCQSNGAWDKPAPTCDVPGNLKGRVTPRCYVG